MEQMIDFDKWFESFIQKEIEYYAIYDPKTSAVTGVYPDHAASNIDHKIKIDKEIAESIFDGKISLTSCFVDVVDDRLELIQVSSLVKIDDILHRIPDIEYVSATDPDISIKFLSDKNLIAIQLSTKLKKKSIRWGGDTKLKFIVCSYNDPHLFYQIIDLTLDQLFVDDFVIPYTGPNSRFSVFTARIFKNYIFEKI
jgi:hypothetical protein